MKRQFFTLLLLSFLISSCGTNKQGDLKPLSKLYQNTTARYNGYFNSQQLYAKSVKILEESYQDNYNQILPMYKEVAIDQTSSVANDLDVTMEKATTVVNLHPRSKWVDDCYFLVGQSQFIKKEYEAAEHTFEYVVKEFHPNNLEIAAMRAAAKYERAALDREGVKAKENDKRRRRKKSTSTKPQTKKSKKTKKRSKTQTSDDVEKDNKKEEKKKTREERLKERKKKKKESSKRAKKKKRSDNSGQLTGANSGKKKSRKDRNNVKEETLKESNKIAKSDEKESYFLKHKPVHSEATLWLAKTYVANKRYDDALFKLGQLEDDINTREDILKQIPEIRAYTYLEKKEYQSVIAPMTLALEHSDKKQRARMNYILGQIYQENGNKAMAAQSYGQVVDLHPSYEMDFHARLNQIRSQWDGQGDNYERTVNLLKKMIKDEKNEEFKDQIFFTLGETYLDNNDVDLAHASFRKAVGNANGNRHILTESYYILAEYDYSLQNYESAKYLYDTTLVNMQKTDERYPPTLSLNKKLTSVTSQLDIIELQDSLVTLSALDDDERRLMAYKIKSERTERLRIAKEIKNPGADKRPIISTGIVSKSREKSNFFVYNEKSLSRGKQDFRKRWGSRVLENNWRRSQKTTESSLTETDLETIEAEELTQAEIDKIFRDVPKNEEEVLTAQEKSKKAMLVLATLYNHELDDKPRSIQTLLHYLKKYEGQEGEEEALYALYLVYKENDQNSLAEVIHKRLEKEYGGGTYVQIINNPTFASDQNTESDVLLAEYDEAYSLYDSGEPSAALSTLKSIREKGTLPVLIAPKIALLSALCIGSIDGKEAYLASLEEVVSIYPNTIEESRAKEILRYLRGDENVFGKEKEEDEMFVTQKNRLHYVLVVIDQVNNEEKINKLRSQVSDYNREYHKLKKLRVGNVFLSKDDTKPILIIRKFTNAELALDYYHSVNKNKENFLNAHESHLLVINQKNYREVLRAKNLEDYESFFKKNYL